MKFIQKIASLYSSFGIRLDFSQSFAKIAFSIIVLGLVGCSTGSTRSGEILTVMSADHDLLAGDIVQLNKEVCQNPSGKVLNKKHCHQVKVGTARLIGKQSEGVYKVELLENSRVDRLTKAELDSSATFSISGFRKK